MANYTDLLMNIIFFGDAYVKAAKRKEDAKAKSYQNKSCKNNVNCK